MDPHLERALLLVAQNRFALAQDQLRQVLRRDPDDATAHALLAFCCVQLDQVDDAQAEARQAIALDPEYDFAYYVLALSYLVRSRLGMARKFAQEAIRLDPEDPRNHALLAEIYLMEEKWYLALAAARQGLACDPHDAACIHSATHALMHLGRVEQAVQTVEAGLAHHPEDERLLAARGLLALEQGRVEQALECFREALRIDPEFDGARQGLLEALRRHNRWYRFWLDRGWLPKHNEQLYWWVVLGLVLAAGGLLLLGGYVFPKAAPHLAGGALAVGLFAFALHILKRPMGNLLLWRDSFGRLVLSAGDRREAVLVGACVAVALGFAVAAGVFSNLALLFGAAAWLGLGITVMLAYDHQPGWPRFGFALVAAVIWGLLLLRLGVIK